MCDLMDALDCLVLLCGDRETPRYRWLKGPVHFKGKDKRKKDKRHTVVISAQCVQAQKHSASHPSSVLRQQQVQISAIISSSNSTTK